MKKLYLSILFSVAVLSSTTVFAAEQIVKLSVPGMTCASCPFIIKKAVSAINGVKLVETALEDRSATVTFDDTVASIDAITKATKDVGYESSVISAPPKS